MSKLETYDSQAKLETDAQLLLNDEEDYSDENSQGSKMSPTQGSLKSIRAS